jgi:4-hydroxybenzoate polyprenyltransferase
MTCKDCDDVIKQAPLNRVALEYLLDWRNRGGRTALITANSRRLAEIISHRTGLFDEVHASCDALTLKGQDRAEYIASQFRGMNIVYMSRAQDDAPVWRVVQKVVTVDASAKLKSRVDGSTEQAEHLGAPRPVVFSLLKAMRPHQWLKNVLVFVPPFAAHVFTASSVFYSFLSFLAFSVVASSVYLMNDLFDLRSDRRHPRKRYRPLASGELTISEGLVAAAVLVGIGLAGGFVIGISFLLVLAAYYLVTFSYSMFFKRRVIIDVCILATLYTLRIIAGGFATGIVLSDWLLAFSIFLFLSLAAVKRQAELFDLRESGQLKVAGRGYHVDDLPLIGQMATSAGYVSVLVLGLYINAPEVAKLYRYPAALWGICLILLYWIGRVAIVAHRGSMHDDPIIFAAQDRVSRYCLLGCCICILLASFG